MNYCPKCGVQLAPGINYCPKCGSVVASQPLKRRNDSANEQVPSFPSVSGVLLCLCVLLNAATFFCMGVVAYDTKQLLWLNQLHGTYHTGGAEIYNCLIGSAFTSVITSVLIIVIGLNKLSKAGNFIMLSCGIITFCVAIYTQNADLYECALLYNYLLWGWIGCTMIYVWTSLYKAICTCSKNQETTSSTLICIVLSLIYIGWFCYTAFSHSEVLR